MTRSRFTRVLSITASLAAIHLVAMVADFQAERRSDLAWAQEFDEEEEGDEDDEEEPSPRELLRQLEDEREELRQELLDPGEEKSLIKLSIWQLDKEIREASGGTATLDDVVRSLWQMQQPIDLVILSSSVETLIGRKPDTLRIANLPGCRKIDASVDSNRDS